MTVLQTAALFALSVSMVSCQNGWQGRTWQTNVNYNSSANWDLGRVPCRGDRVILQKSQSIPVQLPEERTYLRELVLPISSELLLPKDGVVEFTGHQNFPSCDGQDITFKPVKRSYWLDCINWDGWNAATPDLERVPCQTDAVRFPLGSTYRVIMPDIVLVGSLEINGMSVNTIEFAESENMYIGGTDPFLTEDGYRPNPKVLGEVCERSEWCECGNEYLQPQLCPRVVCSVPLCRDPVQPIGSCCPICGAYLLLQTHSYAKKPDLMRRLDTILGDKGVVWHASKVSSETIQIVLVEQEEYSGMVAEEAEKLKALLTGDGWHFETKALHTSGRVWYPFSLGHVVGHFLSVMVVAVLIISAVIVYYTRDWTFVSFAPLEGRPFVFARFENQTGEVVVAQEVAPTNAVLQTFNNPMYEASRQIGELAVACEQDELASPISQTFDNPMYEVTTQKDSGNVKIESGLYTELSDESPCAAPAEDLNNLI